MTNKTTPDSEPQKTTYQNKLGVQETQSDKKYVISARSIRLSNHKINTIFIQKKAPAKKSLQWMFSLNTTEDFTTITGFPILLFICLTFCSQHHQYKLHQYNRNVSLQEQETAKKKKAGNWRVLISSPPETVFIKNIDVMRKSLSNRDNRDKLFFTPLNEATFSRFSQDSLI